MWWGGDWKVSNSTRLASWQDSYFLPTWLHLSWMKVFLFCLIRDRKVLPLPHFKCFKQGHASTGSCLMNIIIYLDRMSISKCFFRGQNLPVLKTQTLLDSVWFFIWNLKLFNENFYSFHHWPKPVNALIKINPDYKSDIHFEFQWVS